MKKRIALILAGTMLMSFVLSACGDYKTASKNDAKKEDTVDTSSDKNKKTTFTVGFDAEYPPYGYMDENGEYTGFDLELAEAVCKLEAGNL